MSEREITGSGRILLPGSNGDITKTINGQIVTTAKPKNYYKMPSGAIAETFPRDYPSAVTAITSGTIQMGAIELEAGQVISNFNYRTGAQAAVGPTNQWLILTDSSRVMVAATANGTTNAIAATTTITQAVATIASGASATYTVPTSGLYYTGLMITVGTTMPTIVNAVTSQQALSPAPILSGTSNTGQTTVPSFAFTATAITAGNPYVYIWLT